jgi:hypothetical protein
MRNYLLSLREAETIQSVAERSRGASDQFELSELDG